MHPFFWLNLLTAVIAGSLSIVVGRRRSALGSQPFAFLMAGVAVWSLAYGLELASTSFATMRWWLWVGYLGIATAPVSWFLFALQYAGYRTRLTRPRVAALFLIPGVTILLNATNGLHGLYYRRMAVDRSGPFPLLDLAPGPWYWVHLSTSLLLLVAGSVVLLQLGRHTARPYHGQIATSLAGAGIAILVTIAYQVGLRPYGHVDLTPIALTLSGALFAYSLLRHGLFDLTPVARTHLFAQLADAVLVLDVRDRVVDSNPVAQRWLGVAIGANLPPVLQAVAHEPGSPLAARIALDGPTSRVVESRLSPLLDRGGQVIGRILILHDVTARVALECEREQLIRRLTAQQQALGASIQAREQAERAARAEADFALQVMQTMGEGLTIVDAEGHFTFVNDAYARLIGSTPAALVGRSPFEMSAATDYATLQAAGAARARGEGSTYLSQLRRTDGSLVDVQITATPRYIDSQCVGSVAVITDLRARLAAEAERLRLERQLLEAQRLESIGTLAGGVAHDFNNLLMAVLGHAELLRLDLPPDSPLGPSVQQIMAGVNQAAELTRQLLAYAGRGQVTRQPVRLNDLIAELGGLLHAVIPPAAQLRYQLAPALPPVIADPTQLRQVLLNLLTNAAEAVGPAGGQITVSTQPVTLHTSAVGPPGAEALAPGAYIQLTVGDTGSGMDAATQARMFEPFYSTKFTGRGLGLAAVQGIVRSHGGAIHVTSAPGAGTAVVVWLPACEAPVPVAAPRAAEGTAAVAGTVLMIDDEAPVRAVTRRLLEHLGMRVLEAEGGAQGLALLADHAGLITAVLLDLTMPEMGGVEVARQLAQRAPHIPVIVMSGYSAEEVEQQMGRLPLAGRLQKPFTLQSLRACLAALTPAAAKRG